MVNKNSMFINVIVLYIVSAIVAGICVVQMERIPNSKFTIEDLSQHWPMFVVPGFNTVIAVLFVIIILFERVVVKLWNRVKDIEL